ncbi:MAG: NAD(P)H:quinone oxidoreductase [Gammaproteobacteria bacterium]|jgi:NAD(P)H dehydrogenase (quinone)|nr:NAD(P)H:quinone oxidoreductase [Xanthomonadales bacterium]
MAETNVLILYYSKHGNTAKMAKLIARGVSSCQGVNAVIRSICPAGNEDFVSSDIFVTEKDLYDCDALILGSPVRFGNMAAPMKEFIDSTGGVWASGGLESKPAAVFTSGSSLHGGQESTLLSMMIPLFHHGMILIGLPYSEKPLLNTESGGTPYGASHWSGNGSDRIIDKNEKELCLALGKRVAEIAKKQKAG